MLTVKRLNAEFLDKLKLSEKAVGQAVGSYLLESLSELDRRDVCVDRCTVIKLGNRIELSFTIRIRNTERIYSHVRIWNESDIDNDQTPVTEMILKQLKFALEIFDSGERPLSDKPFLLHNCDGPIVREENDGVYFRAWKKCTVCNIVWVASQVNLAAVRKLKFNKDETMNLKDYGHPQINEAMQWFEYEHLPHHLKEISKPFAEMADFMATTLYDSSFHGGPLHNQLLQGLRRLLESKDCMVRAAIVKHKVESESEPGKPG